MALAPAPPSADDVQLTANQTRDRLITGVVTVAPVAGLGFVAWQVWGDWLHRGDVLVFAILYLTTGLGITVGFHRHLTHRAFATTQPVRALLAVLGSAAIEGPVISWVADHRKHHAFADVDGDPHSPHVGHGRGWRGATAGLLHAHLGWLFVHTQRAARHRYAPDLVADPIIRLIDRSFVVWAVGGLGMAFGLGCAIGGTAMAGVRGLLWGGAVRIFVLHHVTYSINSLCHYFGSRRFATPDRSSNVFLLAVPSLGESWHNNHHAFPTSAAHGLRWWELDLSSLVIRALARVGLVWDVVEVSRERQARKAIELADA
jgi:stearoyl-CoA desaturase (delta-9 desaturase)